MPLGDGSGPVGEGPLTGRGLGYCAGSDTPGIGKGGIGMGLRRRVSLLMVTPKKETLDTDEDKEKAKDKDEKKDEKVEKESSARSAFTQGYLSKVAEEGQSPAATIGDATSLPGLSVAAEIAAKLPWAYRRGYTVPRIRFSPEVITGTEVIAKKPWASGRSLLVPGARTWDDKTFMRGMLRNHLEKQRQVKSMSDIFPTFSRWLSKIPGASKSNQKYNQVLERAIRSLPVPLQRMLGGASKVAPYAATSLAFTGMATGALNSDEVARGADRQKALGRATQALNPWKGGRYIGAVPVEVYKTLLTSLEASGNDEHAWSKIRKAVVDRLVKPEYQWQRLLSRSHNPKMLHGTSPAPSHVPPGKRGALARPRLAEGI